MLTAVRLELDGRLFDANHLAEQGCETCERSTHLAIDEPGQAACLVLVGGLVDDDADAPVAFGHVAGGILEEDDVLAGQVLGIAGAGIDVDGDESPAAFVVARELPGSM
ncbi:MAG: hypothetical protein U5Q44_01115 [Dehalococcoidia bacterium]|nr:hypothetical protein [Dehalococcoidia bacterium]